MLARTLEQQGITTVSISMVREHTEKVKPPRALWVPFPFGHALGRPNDAELQHRVLKAALDLLGEPTGPVLRDFPDTAESGDQPSEPVQASAVAPPDALFDDPAMEVTQMRQYHTQWLAENVGRTAVGLSGIPTVRFRGIVRFLEKFAEGANADMSERPPEMPLPNFIRYCSDDLKALFFEGRMVMTKNAGGDEIAQWFWGETATGQLLRLVHAQLDASDNPQSKAAAFGIVR